MTKHISVPDLSQTQDFAFAAINNMIAAKHKQLQTKEYERFLKISHSPLMSAIEYQSIHFNLGRASGHTSAAFDLMNKNNCLYVAPTAQMHRHVINECRHAEQNWESQVIYPEQFVKWYFRFRKETEQLDYVIFDDYSTHHRLSSQARHSVDQIYREMSPRVTMFIHLG